MNEQFFEHYTPIPSRLESYGFIEHDGIFVFRTPIADAQMSLEVVVSPCEVKTKVFDLAFGEEFTLHHVKQESGSFVSSIRREYLDILSEIRDKCFVIDSFISADAVFIKSHLREKYKSELEYLWKTPEAAAVRNSDTRKWYACFMHVSRKKVDKQSESDEIVEVMNLHMKAESAEQIIDNKTIFPGFHMNKKYWFSVILDGSVCKARLTELIQASYELSQKMKKE